MRKRKKAAAGLLLGICLGVCAGASARYVIQVESQEAVMRGAVVIMESSRVHQGFYVSTNGDFDFFVFNYRGDVVSERDLEYQVEVTDAADIPVMSGFVCKIQDQETNTGLIPCTSMQSNLVNITGLKAGRYRIHCKMLHAYAVELVFDLTVEESELVQSSKTEDSSQLPSLENSGSSLNAAVKEDAGSNEHNTDQKPDGSQSSEGSDMPDQNPSESEDKTSEQKPEQQPDEQESSSERDEDSKTPELKPDAEPESKPEPEEPDRTEDPSTGTDGAADDQ